MSRHEPVCCETQKENLWWISSINSSCMAINTNLFPYKVKIRIFPQKHTLTRTGMTTSFTVSVEVAHFLIQLVLQYLLKWHIFLYFLTFFFILRHCLTTINSLQLLNYTVSFLWNCPHTVCGLFIGLFILCKTVALTQKKSARLWTKWKSKPPEEHY